MMLIKLRLIVIFVVLLFGLSCCNNNQDGSKGRINIKENKDTLIINDTTFSVVVYFDNGEQKDSVTYVNNKPHGVIKITDKGKVHFRSYVNGRQNGYSRAYYLNGNKAYETFFRNDTIEGEAMFYFQDGHVAAYQCHNDLGEVIYQRKFDLQGNVVKTGGGSAILEYSRSPDTVFLKDKFHLDLTMVTPPYAEVTTLIGFPFREQVRNYKAYNTQDYIEFDTYLRKEEVDTIRVYWEIRDTFSNYVETGKRDFLVYGISVPHARLSMSAYAGSSFQPGPD